MNLDESLRALAADDDSQVPPRVDKAVMAAWDAFADRQGPRQTWMGKSPRRMMWRRHMARTDRFRPWHVGAAACAGLAIGAAIGAVMGAMLITGTTTDNAAGRTVAPPAPLIQNELVLVPEFDRAGPLTLMRVRMTRREFSRLGVPISNPQGDGLVDVEVLVGEDGVARSIRRAVAVGWTGPNR